MKSTAKTVLSPDELERKLYAPDIGKIVSQQIDTTTGAIIDESRLVAFTVPEPDAGYIMTLGIVGFASVFVVGGPVDLRLNA